MAADKRSMEHDNGTLVLLKDFYNVREIAALLHWSRGRVYTMAERKVDWQPLFGQNREGLLMKTVQLSVANPFYTFSGCSRLTTILADATWALPSSGLTGSQCFYSCSTSLVGGNGTTWASNKTAYTYFRIDTANTSGYLTAPENA